MKHVLKKLKQEWEEKILIPFVRKQGERLNLFATPSGIEEALLYIPDEGFDYAAQLGFPGDVPFTRGIYPTMYRGRFWTMRQYSGYATAEESNRRYKYLLEQGQTGLSIAFDLPTQIGYDSDHPLAEGEVGKVGVAIDSLEDMERLLDGIPLDKISTSMTINATAPILLALYMAVAKKQGVPPESLSGTIQNDVLKEYIARGTYIYPPGPSLRLISDVIGYCSENLPKWNPISISGYHIREAGATAVQELAFTFANGVAYVQSAIEAGLDVNRFGKRLSFFFNAHNYFFEEIAKFRAARRIWAKIMSEKFGATEKAALRLRFHTQTAGSTLTAQEPENNVVRVTLQALSAVLGGTQSLHTNAKDEALSLPTEESARLALRTQQIIAYESGVTDTVDPVGGSYFLEALTDEIERRVWAYLEKIEKMGGSVEAISRGFFQREIADSAYRFQKAVDNEERIVVGVNRFVAEKEERPPKILKVDPSVRDVQIRRLKELRARRNSRLVEEKLKALQEAAGTRENLMPFILDCVEAYATVGEISDALRQVFGEYRAPVVF